MEIKKDLKVVNLLKAKNFNKKKIIIQVLLNIILKLIFKLKKILLLNLEQKRNYKIKQINNYLVLDHMILNQI